MQHLPEPAEQHWILDGLASLIRRGGLAPFVSAPIVETNRRYFPEGYSPTLPSVDRLAPRPMPDARLGGPGGGPRAGSGGRGRIVRRWAKHRRWGRGE